MVKIKHYFTSRKEDKEAAQLQFASESVFKVM